jgi:heme/copper-type cytochrome/quinol oxidase subunit 2
MAQLSTLEIIIILTIVFLKFGVIVWMAIFTRQRAEKKKRLFLEAEEERKRTAGIQ